MFNTVKFHKPQGESVSRSFELGQLEQNLSLAFSADYLLLSNRVKCETLQ